MKNKQLPRKITTSLLQEESYTVGPHRSSDALGYFGDCQACLCIIHPHCRFLNNKVFLVRRLERRNVTEKPGNRTAPYLTSHWCQTRRQEPHSAQDIFSLKCGSARTISQVIPQMSNFNLLHTQEDMSSTNKGSVTESKIHGINNTNWTRETKFLKGPLTPK